MINLDIITEIFSKKSFLFTVFQVRGLQVLPLPLQDQQQVQQVQQLNCNYHIEIGNLHHTKRPQHRTSPISSNSLVNRSCLLIHPLGVHRNLLQLKPLLHCLEVPVELL